MTDHAYHQDLVKQRDQAIADRKAAEARIAELTASLQPTEDALTRVCRLAETLPADVRAAIDAAVGASPRELVDRWCLREELEQADTRYVEAACRANQAEARIAAARTALDAVRTTRGVLGRFVADQIEAVLDGPATSPATVVLSIEVDGRWSPVPGVASVTPNDHAATWGSLADLYRNGLAAAQARVRDVLADAPDWPAPTHGLMAIGAGLDARVITPTCGIPGCQCTPPTRADSGPLAQTLVDQRDRIAWALTRPLDLRQQISQILAKARP